MTLITPGMKRHKTHRFNSQIKKGLALLIINLLLLPVLSGARSVQQQHVESRRGRRPPNIIVILADDMGYSDLGAYGSEIQTPNLDRLAREGMRFTSFYNTPRCCPTRASLLTGLYPQQTGVGWMVDQPMQPAGYTRHLNDSCVTIAEALGAAGYHTLMSGKWHIGEEPGGRPNDRGFERSFALINALSNYFGVSGSYPVNDVVQGAMRRIEEIERRGIWTLEGKPYTPPDDGSFYSTQAVTDYAVKMVDEYGRKREPFFLYVAYSAPHWPLHALPQDIIKYRDKYAIGWDATRRARYERLLQLGIINPSTTLPPRDGRVPSWEQAGQLAAWAEPMRFYPRSDGVKPWDRADDRERWAEKMAVYAAQVDRLDQGVGQILAKLKETRADENTLILFLSDNGASSERIDRGVPDVAPGTSDSFLTFGVGWAQVSNTPFRNYKAHTYEGGISTPFMAYWRNHTRPGSIYRQPAHVIDIMATALDAAQVQYPSLYRNHHIIPLEGKSLVPTFENRRRRSITHDALYWEHEGNRAVHQGKWKLVADYNQPWQLYNLEVDRTEQHDLASDNPAKVKRLAAMYDAWAQRANVASWNEFVKKRR